MDSTGQTRAGRDLLGYMTASKCVQVVSYGVTKKALQFAYLREHYV
jgi:hypothetical protein